VVMGDPASYHFQAPASRFLSNPVGSENSDTFICGHLFVRDNGRIRRVPCLILFRFILVAIRMNESIRRPWSQFVPPYRKAQL
jgi:hypothetical protein